MKRKLLIIKLGGSVITNKESPVPSIRAGIINELAGQISDIFHRGYKVILVHGGGSYGHPLAKKYSLHMGMKSSSQLLTFSKVQKLMTQLNLAILESLIKKGLPAVGFAPHSFLSQSAGKLKKYNYQQVREALFLDQIPILYGDIVEDNVWGCSILSGDIIVSTLAREFTPNKIIFLSDVDGIFTADPKLVKSARLIENVTDKNFQKVIENAGVNSKYDVTGQLKGKIQSIKNNLPKKDVRIVNGLIKGNLLKAVLGEKIGTKLFFNY